MNVQSNETFLNIDGFVFVDPAAGLRQRVESFLRSRSWTTNQIFYGDQPESAEVVEEQPAWSLSFVLGLDHIPGSHVDWCGDVEALLKFVQLLQQEQDNEFTMEVRYRSRHWHSEHITFIDNRTPDIAVICAMIEGAAQSSGGPILPQASLYNRIIRRLLRTLQ